MLKIKDNVDLKELEKFNFKKCTHYDLFERYEYHPYLIQAGYVEKVDE